MTDTPKDLASWPRNFLGWPIFTSTNEAILYAQLIYDFPDEQRKLLHCRKETYEELRYERQKKDPDLQVMMDLAITAQFYREAHKEATRINFELRQT